MRPVARVERLPERIDPLRLAERGGHLVGTLPLARMTRLSESLSARDGAVSVDLRFQRDGRHRCLLSGAIEASLAVRCQRCLEPMEIAVAADLRLSVVAAGEETEPPAGYEAIPLGDAAISLLELVEDEILLALPMVPMHEQCPAAP